RRPSTPAGIREAERIRVPGASEHGPHDGLAPRGDDGPRRDPPDVGPALDGGGEPDAPGLVRPTRARGRTPIPRSPSRRPATVTTRLGGAVFAGDLTLAAFVVISRMLDEMCTPEWALSRASSSTTWGGASTRPSGHCGTRSLLPTVLVAARQRRR